MVTEFCQGGDLLNFTLERSSLSEDDVKKIIRQIMESLIYLHKNGICHRDLKLENLMLKEVNNLDNVKIIDFGLAREVKSNFLSKSNCSGSPFYIAPEVINRDIFLASDIWSLGIVMYVCVSGSLLFGGETPQEIMSNILY